MTATSVIKILPVAVLSLHPELQNYRHVEQPKVRERYVEAMVKGWNPLAAGNLLVVEREDGQGFHVVNGGHRLEAMRRLGIETARCEVLTGLNGDETKKLVQTVIDEATARPRSPLDKFNLGLTADLPRQRAIAEILGKYGTVVNSKTGFGAVQKLYEIYEMGVLDSTLMIISSGWDLSAKDARNASCLKAIAGFHNFYSLNAPNRYDVNRLIKVLQGRFGQPRTLLNAARARGFDNNLSANVAREIVRIYNIGLTKKLPAYEGGR